MCWRFLLFFFSRKANYTPHAPNVWNIWIPTFILFPMTSGSVENGYIWKVTILLEIHPFLTEPWLWEEVYHKSRWKPRQIHIYPCNIWKYSPLASQSHPTAHAATNGFNGAQVTVLHMPMPTPRKKRATINRPKLRAKDVAVQTSGRRCLQSKVGTGKPKIRRVKWLHFIGVMITPLSRL